MQKGECGNSVKTTQSATTTLLPNQAVKLVKEHKKKSGESC